jgi:small-conductance mechanosensitive channel
VALATLAITLSPAGTAPLIPGGTPTLTLTCGRAPSIVCRTVWDLTHNSHAADFVSAYLAGPVQLGLRIAFVLVLAVLVRLGARRLIKRLTTRAAAGHESADAAADSPGHRSVFGERRSQRATALASVLGNAASVTIFSIAAVIILGDLGLNLAPLLASAGVLGVAFGFGAQNLVRDFLSGIFILLEDQYGVGDVVDIGVVGTVEAVTLRITRLRDINGVVWHIRNGTIKAAGNETHGWARAVVDFPVPSALPVAAARGALERAVVALWDEPAWHAVILDRPQIWGVESVSADTVLIRVAARTAPQSKVKVARELRERLKTALDAETATGTGTPAIAGTPAGAGTPAIATTSAVPRQPDPPQQ